MIDADNDNWRMIDVLRRMQAEGKITRYFAHNDDGELKEYCRLAAVGPNEPRPDTEKSK